jgi:hypothetical protein
VVAAETMGGIGALCRHVVRLKAVEAAPYDVDRHRAVGVRWRRQGRARQLAPLPAPRDGLPPIGVLLAAVAHKGATSIRHEAP